MLSKQRQKEPDQETAWKYTRSKNPLQPESSPSNLIMAITSLFREGT